MYMCIYHVVSTLGLQGQSFYWIEAQQKLGVLETLWLP